MKHKKIITLVLVCVCIIGSVMFIAEHRQSATENVANDVVIDDSTAVVDDSGDSVTPEEVAEISTEISSEEASEGVASTEVVPEEVAEEEVSEEKVPTAEELNQIGVTVGDSYEFSY